MCQLSFTIARPKSEFLIRLQILESGLIQEIGFDRVGVAAHPEGHPVIPEDVLMDVLVRKVQWAARTGIDVYLETQFCFEVSF